MDKPFSISIPNADNVLVEFFARDLELASDKVTALKSYLEAQHPDTWIDLVPAYNSLCAFVPFPKITAQQLKTIIENYLCSPEKQVSTTSNRRFTLPCLYGGEHGLDLERLCKEKKLSQDEVIRLHSQKQYRVYAIGFSPGFPYLGQVDERIALPRLAVPRTSVPRGAVGIAERQTGIYPTSSPGGWNIIGRCPSQLFHPHLSNNNICTLNVGDTVQFTPITLDEYRHLLEEDHER